MKVNIDQTFQIGYLSDVYCVRLDSETYVTCSLI